MASLIRLCVRSAPTIRQLTGKPLTVRNYAEAAAVDGGMRFTFASPSEAFYQNSISVKQVDVPTGTGAIGILAHHVPTLGVLAPGVLTVVEENGDSKKFFVSSGCYSVNEDASVFISAEEAAPLEHLDKEIARSNLAKAQASLSSASSDGDKAAIQVAIECNEAIINA